MRKIYKKYFEITKLFDSNLLDKKTTRKINWTATLTALPVMLIYAIILFTTSTVYVGMPHVLKMVFAILPCFVCLFFGLVSLFTLQLYKNYLPDNEEIQNVTNYKFFLVGLINPIVVLFTIAIVIVMCVLL